VLKSKPLAIRDFQSAEPPEAIPLDEVAGRFAGHFAPGRAGRRFLQQARRNRHPLTLTQGEHVTDVKTIPVGDMKVRVSGTGFPLILVHGFTTTSEFWREQVEEFSASYQVIRLNLPGHGISPSPTTRSYTIDAFVEDLEGIFQHLSFSRAALVGLSMGGVVAQKFAVKNPQLLQSLVLVDTTANGLGQDVRAFWRLLIISVLRRPARM